MPFCYYDKNLGKLTVKIICSSDIKKVTLIYGDPFMYKKTEKLDEYGNNIWTWEYEKLDLSYQYISEKNIMWRANLTLPKTKRIKYAFILTDTSDKIIYYSENGTMEFTEFASNMPHNHFYMPFIHEVDALYAPEWANNVTWYQIFPDRFSNGDNSISPKNIENWETGKPTPTNFFGGDLRGIINKLPYLNELGVTGIYMTPIFTSPTNHKYDIQDYFEIDPAFGDLKTLKELVKKAHEMGIKVMLDAVFNHIGSKHVFWQDILKNQERSKYKDYFHIQSFPVYDNYNSRESLNYHTFGFSTNMPKWNTENPEARKYLIDAALYWIKECDIDGWRLDVSDEVSFDFWHDFRKAIADVKKDFYVLGEIWHDPTKWLSGRYFDAAMNYPLGHLIKDMFINKRISPDIFSQELNVKMMKFSDIHNQIQFNLMDSHDTARLLTQARGNKLAVKNAFLFMLFMKGAPCVYYGTEIAMEGSGDPDCRRPMIWDEKRQDKEMLEFFKAVISLRKRYNSLVQDAGIYYKRDGDLCSWRLSDGKSDITIFYNAGEEDIRLMGEVKLSTSASGEVLKGNSIVIV